MTVNRGSSVDQELMNRKISRKSKQKILPAGTYGLSSCSSDRIIIIEVAIYLSMYVSVSHMLDRQLPNG